MGQALTLVLAAGVILFAGWGFTQETRVVKAYTPQNLMRQSGEAVAAEKPAAISADEVVRLHVRANSNSPEDQAVKVAVRDALMENFGKTLSETGDFEEAKEVLTSRLPDIVEVAGYCLRVNGFRYDAKAALQREYFPEDCQYQVGDAFYLLPAGWYPALRVDLGKAEGDNWWCVMYPPLCYFDLVQKAVLKYGGADAEPGVREAALIVDELSTKDVPVEVRSLLLDTLRSSIRKLAEFLTRVKPGATRASEMP